MGLRHGAYCFGCCWALFAVLVATGVMSLAWMLLLTLVVFVEKMLPQGRRAGAATGIALIALGIVVASGASRCPGLRSRNRKPEAARCVPALGRVHINPAAHPLLYAALDVPSLGQHCASSGHSRYGRSRIPRTD